MPPASLRFFSPPCSALRSCSDVSPPGSFEGQQPGKGSYKVHSHILGNSIFHSPWQKTSWKWAARGDGDPIRHRGGERVLLNGVRVVFWRAKQKDPARRAGFVASLCCRSPGRTEGRRGKKKKTRRDNIQTHLVLVCRSLDQGGIRGRRADWTRCVENGKWAIRRSLGAFWCGIIHDSGAGRSKKKRN